MTVRASRAVQLADVPQAEFDAALAEPKLAQPVTVGVAAGAAGRAARNGTGDRTPPAA
jgi:hypothetical protein